MAGVLEHKLTVIGKAVMISHPELHHYTDEAGLRGIVGSNTLRATHFSDLNDSTEITHLGEKLAPELISIFTDILRKRRVRSHIEKAIVANGGLKKSASSLAEDLVRAFYDSAFEREGDEISITASAPFVSSLCTHTLEPYSRNNGLLSQWRGYGASGRAGFCLVFDTQKLAAMLGREFDRGSYSYLNLEEVKYAFSDRTMRSLFPDLIETCEAFVTSALAGAPQLPNGIARFFPAATLLKHEAFFEEREVRIVCIPMTERLREEVAKRYPDANLGPKKPVLPEGARAGARRYIELFDGDSEAIPIKRVIVGPRPDQADQVAIAEEVSKGRFEVVASKTPYKG